MNGKTNKFEIEIKIEIKMYMKNPIIPFDLNKNRALDK
jgi:hypothetical protein